MTSSPVRAVILRPPAVPRHVNRIDVEQAASMLRGQFIDRLDDAIAYGRVAMLLDDLEQFLPEAGYTRNDIVSILQQTFFPEEFLDRREQLQEPRGLVTKGGGRGATVDALALLAKRVFAENAVAKAKQTQGASR